MTSVTPYQACYFAHELTRLGTLGELDRLSTTLFDSKVDLNPHQVDAALFAISNPLQKGVILADEVGLGKTIEAGLVLCQRWAERRRKLLVVSPAHIRKQWQAELSEKFNLPAMVMDRKVWTASLKDGNPNPFDCGTILIISYGFAARMKDDLRAIPFDLVVFDEAHKLRNAYQPSRKGGQAIRWAFELRQKILLTATPLQNSLTELYGLGWLIDDHLFGERSSFQSRYCNAGGDIEGLRARLAGFCKRTLRRDCPYVNYKKRQAMTHPFAQTDEERVLHQDVMDFMGRDVSFAFPQRQRQLIEMILFKTLASSPQALASTLRTMRQRLITLRDGLPPAGDEELLEELAADDDVDLDALLEQIDGLDADEPAAAPPVQGRLLAAELAQIDSLIGRAEKITCDSKSKALLQALQAAFARLETLGARRKALIFTESRKTQAFLAGYLEANGYAGKVVTFNGSNTHPSAAQACERFTRRHAGTDKLTGSKAIDIRSALIEEFRDSAEILLATEAAAEGVNLQFCSLVVNYDLPWNPQRIEQRIGRCHRYGQERDVVVVNFLSQDNLADRRVQDLLQQKFNLFDGLFGASDEVLGAIEEGVDFEKRVLAILKTCRTDEQIESAFNHLQRELEGTISQKMTSARQQLFEHFDADVHERLKIRAQNAEVAVDRVGERFWKLARWGLHGQASFDDTAFGLDLPHPPADGIPAGHYRLISAVRAEADYTASEAHLLRLSSPLGQWLLARAKRAIPSSSPAPAGSGDPDAPSPAPISTVNADALSLAPAQPRDIPLSPSPGTPGEGRGGGGIGNPVRLAEQDPHLNPPPAYQGRTAASAPLVSIHAVRGDSSTAATVHFDVTHQTRKVTILQPLVGNAGWLRLDKLTLDSDAREEFLLFTGVTDAGENLDQEQVQRLFDVAGSIAGDCCIGEAVARRLAEDAERLANATLLRAGQAGSGRFRQVQTQVNQWADDKIAAAEVELDAVRRELREARRQADLAETVAAQQSAMEQISQLEAKRRRARRNIDDVEEKVETDRQDLLRQLQARCQQKHFCETLFTIRFETV